MPCRTGQSGMRTIIFLTAMRTRTVWLAIDARRPWEVDGPDGHGSQEGPDSNDRHEGYEGLVCHERHESHDGVNNAGRDTSAVRIPLQCRTSRAVEAMPSEKSRP